MAQTKEQRERARELAYFAFRLGEAQTYDIELSVRLRSGVKLEGVIVRSRIVPELKDRGSNLRMTLASGEEFNLCDVIEVKQA